MLTSIMLVTYNRLNLTQRMLENLFKNTDSPYRLIIIDNCSTDGTVEWLKTITPSLTCKSCSLKFNDKNLGIAIARNQALEIAAAYKDKWLCTIDNDVELPFGWLKECIEIMQLNKNFAIGVNMENIPYPIVTMNGKQFQYKKAGNLGTACTVFDKRLHDLIGFFNTEFGLYGEEDADFFFRARRVGYKLGYIKKMGVHFGSGKLESKEYLAFKAKSHAANLNKFKQNCNDYCDGRKKLYISFNG